MAEVLENVGLADAIHKMPSQLSGGMRKRISLARTIIVDPEIILYDEPTTGLDPVTSDEISELINEVQKNIRHHLSSSPMILNVPKQQLIVLFYYKMVKFIKKEPYPISKHRPIL